MEKKERGRENSSFAPSPESPTNARAQGLEGARGQAGLGGEGEGREERE